MKYKRYWGEFLSREDTRWGVEIWQEATGAGEPLPYNDQVGAGEPRPYNDRRGGVSPPLLLCFPADSPLVIEWAETETVVEPLQGSSATLRVVSDRDRRFLDLYTVEAGSVRMDVYRNGGLYWSGTLDTEQYEEPYSWEEGYVVEFVFSDFGILQRCTPEGRAGWSAAGTVDLRSLVRMCMDATLIHYEDVAAGVSFAERVSTCIYHDANSSSPVMGNAYVFLGNFVKGDGKWMSFEEILKHVLLPFSLRIRQYCGCIHVYDINSLMLLPVSGRAVIEELYWTGTDALLSVEKTYNNVRVVFNPGIRRVLIDGGVAADDPIFLSPAQSSSQGGDYVIATSASDNRLAGVELKIRSRVAQQKVNALNFYSTTPVYQDETSSGVVFLARIPSVTEGVVSTLTKVNTLVMTENGPQDSALMRDRPYVFAVAGYHLNLTANFLLSSRMNPFAGADDSHQGIDFLPSKKDMGKQTVRLKLYYRLRALDGFGRVEYHYRNAGMSATGWYQGDYSGDWSSSSGGAAMVFYDEGQQLVSNGNIIGESRRWSDGGPFYNGFCENKNVMGGVETSEAVLPSGELIPFPPSAGFLELEVSSKASGFTGTTLFSQGNTVPDLRWAFLKDVELRLRDRYYREVADDEKVVHSYVEAGAEEELELSTMVGTLDAPHPSATGQVYDIGRIPLLKFVRNDHSGSLEELLTGTVYSHYKGRKLRLSGSARIAAHWGLSEAFLFTEAHQGDKRFYVSSEVQDLIADETQIVAVEGSVERYAGVLL